MKRTRSSLLCLFGLCLAATLLSACGAFAGWGDDAGLGDSVVPAGPGGPPSIDAVVPAQASNAGGSLISLTGTNFSVGATLQVGGVPATEVVVWSSTRITARLPSNPAAFGRVPVLLSTRDGLEVSRDDLFLYYAKPPLFPLPVIDSGSRSFVNVGDWNGDGRPDLATGSSDSARVLLNDARGGFTLASSFVIGTLPLQATRADFNRDGQLDLVTVNSTSNDLSLLVGDGAGGFSAATRFAAGSGPGGVVSADWDGDGSPDLAVSSSVSSAVRLWYGDGQGAFPRSVSVPVGLSPNALVVADWNGDARPDLAVGSADSSEVSILLGTADGGVATPVVVLSGQKPGPLAAADFNRDGSADLVVAHAAAKSLSVLRGNGSGGFDNAGSVAIPETIVALAVGDWNGDHSPDLAFTHATSNLNNLSVLMGDGKGGFQAPRSFYCAGYTGADVRAADMNGDEALDLVIASSAGLLVLLGDGQGGFVSDSLLAGSTQGLLVGDFNDDHNLDVITSTGLLQGDGNGGVMARSVGSQAMSRPCAVGDWNGDRRLDFVGCTIATAILYLGRAEGDFDAGHAVGLDFSLSLLADLAAGDWNGDQKLDLLVLTQTGKQVSVLLGSGNGEFSVISTSLSVPLGIARTVAVGDFNKDHKLDAVVSGINGVYGAFALTGDGQGGFSYSTPLFRGRNGGALAVGDLNADGAPDIILSDGTSTLQIALGNGRGDFPTTISRPSGAGALGLISPLLVADWDGDKKDDVVSVGCPSVGVLLGGEPVATTALRFFIGPGSNCAGALGDFNKDNQPDVLVSTGSSVLLLTSQLGR